MDKRRKLMPFRAVLEPVTNYGVQMGFETEFHAPRFHIYECGFLAQGSAEWKAENIFSPFWRLWYTTSAGYWLESHGQHWDLGPERIICVPAQVVFSTGSDYAAPQLWIHFSLVPDYAFESREAFEMPMDDLLHEQIKSLIDAHCTTSRNCEHLLYHRAAALLHNCFAQHALPLRALPEALRSILHEIENAPASDLSNTHLAHRANMSSGHFIRWFKKHMNQSPAAYVHQVRLKRASWMLLFSDLSIGQIAVDVGFRDRDYFSRAFIHHVGCGPATFRKNHLALTVK